MIKHTNGFMLIEVMIAALISTIIAAALFVVLNQINKGTVVTQNYADVYAKASIVNKQFERDLSGFFLPLASNKDINKKEQPAKEPTPNAIEQDPKKTPQKNQPAVLLSEEKKIKLISHVFYATNKNKNLELLTFITNNPMQVYWSEKSGKAKPRAARVVYRLIPDAEFKNSFILTRQEGTNLYYDIYTKKDKNTPRAYEMIDGIKSMTLEYAVEKPSDGKTESQKKSIELKKEWKNEQAKDQTTTSEQKNSKKEKKKFPEYVIIHLLLWDDQKKNDTEFTMRIPLIAQGEQPPEPQESIAARLLEQSKAQQQALPPANPMPAPIVSQNKPTLVPPLKTKDTNSMVQAHSIPISLSDLNKALKNNDLKVLNNMDNFYIVPDAPGVVPQGVLHALN